MLRVGLLLFDDVEVLDACGPFEVLSVANRVAGRQGRPAPFEVVTVGVGQRPVVARRGCGSASTSRWPTRRPATWCSSREA